MVTIARVWIDEGCIGCGECPRACPEIFDMLDGDAAIRGEARVDGMLSPNRDERSPLNAFGLGHDDAIEEAAHTCPVEVIRFSAPEP